METGLCEKHKGEQLCNSSSPENRVFVVLHVRSQQPKLLKQSCLFQYQEKLMFVFLFFHQLIQNQHKQELSEGP